MSDLLGLWHDKEPALVIAELQQLNKSEWAEWLTQLLDSKSVDDRGRAVIAIALWHRETDAPFNLTKYQQGYWQGIRHKLASQTPEKAIEFFGRATNVVRALARTDGHRDFLAQIAQTVETSESIRYEALRLLADIDIDLAFILSRTALESVSSEIRSVALGVIGKAGKQNPNITNEAVHLLTECLMKDGQDIIIYETSAAALASIEGDESIEALKTVVVQANSRDAKLAALESLQLKLPHSEELTQFLLSVRKPQPDKQFQNSAIQASPRSYSPKVLIVEDTLELAEMLQVTLERINLVVELAHTGSEAQTIIRSWQPDLVLLDLSLPDGSGWRVIEVAKNWATTNDIYMPKIVIITAYYDPANRLVAKMYGVHDYLIKPFTPNEVERVAVAVLNL